MIFAVDREIVSEHRSVCVIVEVLKMTINVLIIVHRKFGMRQINIIAWGQQNIGIIYIVSSQLCVSTVCMYIGSKYP